MSTVGGRPQTLAQLNKSGTAEERKELHSYLLDAAAKALNANKKKIGIMYYRLAGLVERKKDHSDLLWQIVTSFMQKFFDEPIIVHHRAVGDNRPDWQLFIERPSLQSETSGMQRVINNLLRGPRGKRGRLYGKGSAVLVTSFDQPIVNNASGENESDETSLYEVIADESVGIDATEEQLTATQWRETLARFAPRCIEAITTLRPDRRYEVKRRLAVAFIELICSGRLPEIELDEIFSVKKEGHLESCTVNELALAKLLTHYGFSTTDKTAGGAFELVQETLITEIEKAALPGGCNV